jgi:hypothetical protein
LNSSRSDHEDLFFESNDLFVHQETDILAMTFEHFFYIVTDSSANPTDFHCRVGILESITSHKVNSAISSQNQGSRPAVLGSQNNAECFHCKSFQHAFQKLKHFCKPTLLKLCRMFSSRLLWRADQNPFLARPKLWGLLLLSKSFAAGLFRSQHCLVSVATILRFPEH